ncbi:uncharacterized protein B0T15DRAFT_525790 [Chaetomium strumarium]|uniref:Protection of telomeres protein 1 n=1 Tax=Chaetomium strumarium TaxID=1170767 RepID=A0AAJ0H047_9PEZI|nr:hypothetical protein B0T15DRAFT_525790 [Chaetomium strumarium]
MSARGWRKGGRDATPQDPLEPPLPAKLTELRALQVGNLVNVIGLVKDWRRPINTRSKDWKSEIEVYDLSTADGVKFTIFWPEHEHPDVGAGDVLLIISAKVQNRPDRGLQERPSLITHITTSVYVYSASNIPKPPQSAQPTVALGKRDRGFPTAEQNRYVSYLFHKVDKTCLSEEHEFKVRAEQSLNVKNKFRQLKDVDEGRFCDLIAQVVTEPYGIGVVTLYVSDYTENAKFYNEQSQPSSEPVDDPYGYTSGGVSVPRKKWIGPYGKMSLQITCYEPHANAIREEVKVGDWVELRNVRIKYGHDGKNLEGVMHEERNLDPSRVNVRVLEATDGETIDPRLKEAIRRCRDYHKNRKQQLKDIKSAQAAGLKRKGSQSNSAQPGKRQLNAKERRKLLRQAPRDAQEQQAQEQQAKEQQAKERLDDDGACLELNDLITCEKHDVPFSTVESMVKPYIFQTTVDNESVALPLPFICAKYMARLRVVDYFPPSLEDFARSRKLTDFDVLSDNEDDGDSSSPSSSSSGDDEDSPGRNRTWEWLFALRLEDVEPPSTEATSGPRPRLWAYVNNAEAQCLTGLNATDLRRDPETLRQFRQAMSILWGNLEEHKARKMGKGQTAGTSEKRPTRRGKNAQLLERPPLNSDGEDVVDEEEPLSNKPFACCIKQYGIPIPDDDGRKWQRCFGLFGTKICS